jgi:hypothetical protein
MAPPRHCRRALRKAPIRHATKQPPPGRTLQAAEDGRQRAEAAGKSQSLGAAVVIPPADRGHWHDTCATHLFDCERPRDSLGRPQQRQYESANQEWHDAQALGQNSQPEQHRNDAPQRPLLIPILRAIHSNLRWARIISEAAENVKELFPIFVLRQHRVVSAQKCRRCP